MNRTAWSYDVLAEQYAKKMLNELDHKPFDREVLDSFFAKVRDAGNIVDLGCGPGQVGRYLSDKGGRVAGLDLSTTMVELARSFHPGMTFRQGDMLALPFSDGSLAGLIAFYSIIHLDESELDAVFAEMRRVLEPGGLLLVSFHIGRETRHFDTLWGTRVDVDFHFFIPDEIRAMLTAAGMEVLEVLERGPYPEAIEAQTRRCYLLAGRPG
jgi:SAM-dependent methyltransferase